MNSPTQKKKKSSKKSNSRTKKKIHINISDHSNRPNFSVLSRSRIITSGYRKRIKTLLENNRTLLENNKALAKALEEMQLFNAAIEEKIYIYEQRLSGVPIAQLKLQEAAEGMTAAAKSLNDALQYLDPLRVVGNDDYTSVINTTEFQNVTFVVSEVINSESAASEQPQPRKKPTFHEKYGFDMSTIAEVSVTSDDKTNPIVVLHDILNGKEKYGSTNTDDGLQCDENISNCTITEEPAHLSEENDANIYNSPKTPVLLHTSKSSALKSNIPKLKKSKSAGSETTDTSTKMKIFDSSKTVNKCNSEGSETSLNAADSKISEGNKKRNKEGIKLHTKNKGNKSSFIPNQITSECFENINTKTRLSTRKSSQNFLHAVVALDKINLNLSAEQAILISNQVEFQNEEVHLEEKNDHDDLIHVPQVIDVVSTSVDPKVQSKSYSADSNKEVNKDSFADYNIKHNKQCNFSPNITVYNCEDMELTETMEVPISDLYDQFNKNNDNFTFTYNSVRCEEPPVSDATLKIHEDVQSSTIKRSSEKVSTDETVIYDYKAPNYIASNNCLVNDDKSTLSKNSAKTNNENEECSNPRVENKADPHKLKRKVCPKNFFHFSSSDSDEDDFSDYGVEKSSKKRKVSDASSKLKKRKGKQSSFVTLKNLKSDSVKQKSTVKKKVSFQSRHEKNDDANMVGHENQRSDVYDFSSSDDLGHIEMNEKLTDKCSEKVNPMLSSASKQSKEECAVTCDAAEVVLENNSKMKQKGKGYLNKESSKLRKSKKEKTVNSPDTLTVHVEVHRSEDSDDLHVSENCKEGESNKHRGILKKSRNASNNQREIEEINKIANKIEVLHSVSAKSALNIIKKSKKYQPSSTTKKLADDSSPKSSQNEVKKGKRERKPKKLQVISDSENQYEDNADAHKENKKSSSAADLNKKTKTSVQALKDIENQSAKEMPNKKVRKASFVTEKRGSKLLLSARSSASNSMCKPLEHLFMFSSEEELEKLCDKLKHPIINIRDSLNGVKNDIDIHKANTEFTVRDKGSSVQIHDRLSGVTCNITVSSHSKKQENEVWSVRTSDFSSDIFILNEDNPGADSVGKRQSRRARPATYKEPDLHSKMRRPE